MSQVDTTTNAGQLLAAASGGRRRLGDRVFSRTAVLAAVTILALLAGVAIFLLSEGFHRSIYPVVPLVLAGVALVSGLTFARFMERRV